MSQSKSTNISAIEKATGVSWSQWLEYMDKINAAQLPHKEIADSITTSTEVSGWWAQSITVAYEQHIGRRMPGQDSKGNFSVSVSKTLPGDMDHALSSWKSLVAGCSGFAGVNISRNPKVSRTAKWRYWRCGLEDGSLVIVSIQNKGPDKAVLAILHDEITDQKSAEAWRAFWKQFITKL